jgi:hypothetical protein
LARYSIFMPAASTSWTCTKTSEPPPWGREQGAFFGICREEQRGIANGCRVGRRFTLGTRRPHNSIVGPPHLAAVQKIVDALIQRDARDELTRLTHRLERLRFRAEPEGDAP